MPDNIVLVGFMGAGKSSVGRLLATKLGRCFVETDDMIVAREGRSIPEIFAARGEAYFRSLEDEALSLLRLKDRDVIATGGGLPCRDGRPEALQALGTVVWLTGDFATLYERALRAGERPMLAGRRPARGRSRRVGLDMTVGGRLHELSAAEAARRIRTGELSPTDLLAACLARIDAAEPVVQAWVELDRAAALRVAGEREAEARA